jgi:ribose transport system permease protein
VNQRSAVLEHRIDPILDRLRWAVGEGYAVWFVVLGLFVYASTSSDLFLTSRNIENYLGQVPVLIIASIGMLIAVLAGAIDLSVAAVAKLSAVLISGIGDGDVGKFVVAVLLAYLIGAAVGAVNASIIVRFRVEPFIVTLGMFSVLEGLVLAYTVRGRGSVPSSVVSWAYEAIGPLPYVFLVTLGIVAATTLWIRHARFALHLVAFGGDREVTRRAGISSTPIVFVSMITCSMFAVTAGLAQVMRAGVGAPTTGDGLELAAITAIVVGGASLAGGRGRVLGAVGGAVLLTLVDNSLNMMRVSQYNQGLVRGAVIVLAVALFMTRRERAA